MYTNEDFERFFLRYKAEAYPVGESIQSFCIKHNVAYNLFEKWYKDTRHGIVSVKVEDSPQDQSAGTSPVAPSASAKSSGVRILLDLRVSNGLHIRQKNLSYAGLLDLIEKLEGLC